LNLMNGHSSPAAREKPAFRRPPGRYDEARRTPRWLTLVGAAVLGIALLAFSYAAWQRTSAGRTSVTVLGYHVVDDHAVDVRFEVSKGAGTTVVCAVRARDRDGVEVGSEDVTVGPGSTVVTHRLTTSRRAATGEVTGCSN
jgi:hypothetical protein